MSLSINTIKIGDFVKVKRGTKDPDFEYQLMDDWQGKVIEIDKEYNLISIEWDAQTKASFPTEYLNDLIEEGLDTNTTMLEITELEPVTQRLNDAQTQQLNEAFASKEYWLDLCDGKARALTYIEWFKGISLSDEFAMYERWETYLQEHLQLPMDTKVVEGRIKLGEHITILAIEGYEDHYGVFGIGKQGREAISFPLCELEATDKTSKNYRILKDYVIWFANR